MLNIGNLSRREKAILILAVSIIALSAFSHLILSPYLKKLEVLDKEIFQQENKLNKAKRLIPRKSAVQKDFQGIVASLAVSEGMSVEQQTARILIELENLSNQAGVHLTDIKPRPIKSSGYYNEFVVEIRLEADIKEITKFIYVIQQSQELLKIEKLQLNIKSDESSSLEGFLEIHKISI